MTSTRRKKIIKNKTKKNLFSLKTSVLTEEIIPIETIINDTKEKSVSDYINNEFIRMFNIPNSSKGKHLLKNDFYTYINDFWIGDFDESSEDTKFLNKLDDFRIVQFRTLGDLNNLIKKYIKETNSVVSTQVNNLYSSVLKLNSPTSSLNYLRNIISYIDELREDKNNLWKMLAFVNKNEFTNIFGPFAWSFSPDKKNSKEYINYINPHQFAVFDTSIYERSDYKKRKRNNEYEKYFTIFLNKLFKLTAPYDKKLKGSDTFEIGQKFYDLFGMYDSTIKESPDLYNKITKEEALNKYKFNWVEYCKALGYEEKKIPDVFIVSNLQFFKFCTEELLENWNNEKWRSYWVWLYAKVIARFTDGWSELVYEFHGKQIRGLSQSITIKQNRTYAAVAACAWAFNPLLNNIYIENYYNENNIVFTNNLAINLKNILKNQIHRNKWLEPKTKKYAIFKIEEIKLEVGSQKINGKYEKILPLLNYDPDKFLDNYFGKVAEWRHNLYISGNIDMIKTLVHFDYNSYPYKIVNLPSYIVNAQYTPIYNEIKISTAYLQKPFIDIIDRSIEYNLAYIGFTICHELCHSLDDTGSQYDVNGNLNNWWGKKDKQKFKKIQQDIIKNYITFSKYDGLKYDPTNTIGEDIADISAIRMCEEYLRDYCLQNKFSAPLTYLHFKMFYDFFANQMKQKIKKKSIKYELMTNPHAIDKYRTNVTLARSKLFKYLYEIKKGDKMYWDDKLTAIWD